MLAVFEVATKNERVLPIRLLSFVVLQIIGNREE
jgi:hypothetical protein